MKPPARESELLRQSLSDLVDGRLDDLVSGRCCDDWARDPELRRTWHAYQLIGDVLRSDDLATTPARDAAFLVGIQQRLAAEPVVLAPAPLLPAAQQPQRSRRASWRVPVAVAAAAGFVAVAGVLVALQQTAAVDPGATLVQTVPAPQVLPRRDSDGLILSTEDSMQRNALVDEYLRAHREVFAGSPPALPGGALRTVELTVPPR